MAYVRLAPDDPARWNRPFYDMHEPIWEPGLKRDPVGPDAVHEIPFGAQARVRVERASAGEVLQRLDRIALAFPRTRRLARDEERGLATWVTRSAFWGFPDYTTAEVRQDGPDVVLALAARQRYGRGDYGVNAARLRDWLTKLGAE